MSFRIGTNMGALEAYGYLQKANADTMKAQLRLASRSQINRVADDVSGFNVGKSLQSKIAIMKAAEKNIGAAGNILSTAESALKLIKDKLTTIRTYIADASDPTKDRKAISDNIKSLGDEIENILKTTKFNDTKLLIGEVALSSLGAGKTVATASMASLSASFTFQTGADVTDRINLDFASGLASTSAAGYSTSVANAISSFSFAGVSINAASLQNDWGTAIASLAYSSSGSFSDSIIGKFESAIDDALGKIGNFTQRLEVKSEYLAAAIYNATDSVNRLFDANMALEQLNATKSQIGANVATNMLGQLNFAPQNILSLFQ